MFSPHEIMIVKCVFRGRVVDNPTNVYYTKRLISNFRCFQARKIDKNEKNEIEKRCVCLYACVCVYDGPLDHYLDHGQVLKDRFWVSLIILKYSLHISLYIFLFYGRPQYFSVLSPLSQYLAFAFAACSVGL